MGAVLRQRNFVLVWLAGVVSVLGDWVLNVGLPFYVYERTGSVLATGAMLAARTVPALLLGPVAGVFVDRWDRRRTMLAADVLRAAAVLALLAVQSDDGLWLIYPVAFLLSAIGQFFGPAQNALLPRLVGEAYLLRANALTALGNELTRLVAAPLGGALMASLGLASVVWLDSVSFLASALAILLIAAPAPTGAAARAAGSPGAGADPASQHPGRLGGLMSPGRLIGVSGALTGALALVIPFCTDRRVVLALVALIGFPVIPFFVTVQTLLQANVPDAFRGRVFGAHGTANTALLLIGMGVAGPTADRFGIVPMLLAGGGLYFVAGVVALLLLPAGPAGRAPEAAAGPTAGAPAQVQLPQR
jgi:MFS family permease